MSKTTFGEWLRWTIARREIQRADLAAQLGISQSTITNLYAREVPDGVNDVTLAKLAALLGMTEPELMVKWKDGLPSTPAAPKPSAKPKQSNKGK